MLCREGLLKLLYEKCEKLGPSFLQKFGMDRAAAEEKVLPELRQIHKVLQPDELMIPFDDYPNDICPKTGQKYCCPYPNGKP